MSKKTKKSDLVVVEKLVNGAVVRLEVPKSEAKDYENHSERLQKQWEEDKKVAKIDSFKTSDDALLLLQKSWDLALNHDLPAVDYLKKLIDGLQTLIKGSKSLRTKHLKETVEVAESLYTLLDALVQIDEMVTDEEDEVDDVMEDETKFMSAKKRFEIDQAKKKKKIEK